MPRTGHISLPEALAAGPPPPGNNAVPVFENGTLVVEMYQPRGVDKQTPHDRDEVYIVAKGTAQFRVSTGRRPVEAGTFLFVAAGEEHKFEEMSDDFATWVVFYGPVGGETP